MDSPLRFPVFLLLAASFAACASPAPPSSAARDKEVSTRTFQQAEKVIRQPNRKDNPLTELEALEAEHSWKSAPGRESLTMRLAVKQAEVGDYAGAHYAADLAIPRLVRSSAPPEGHTPVSALEAILQAAETSQVIMINEAHHVPQHRAFTLELLHALRQKGFTYFAAETLSHMDDFTARGYPTRETGAYTAEPLYGDLVRTALRLGYRVVPYESIHGSTPAKREPEQATRLLDATLRQDSKAKVLVHVGFSHNDEALQPPWMAGHFKQMSGIDPFTVNQYWMTERSVPELEGPAYRWATERGLVTRPVVFRDAGGSFWSPWVGFDLVVFHPRSQYENGRPAWLSMGGLRAPHLLPDGVCGIAPRCLLRAWFAVEGEDAIPIDQVVAEAGKPTPALMLPPGDFVVRVEDTDGAVISEQTLRMPQDGLVESRKNLVEDD